MSDVISDPEPVGRQLDKRSGWAVAVVTCIALVAIAAVALLRQDVLTPPTTYEPQAAQDPQDLVGIWTTEGADLLNGQVIVMAPTGDFTLLLDDCEMGGSWRASGSGLAVVDVWFADGQCGSLDEHGWSIIPPGIAWFESQGTVRRLLDSDGDVVLTMTPGPAPDELPAEVMEDVDFDATDPTADLPPALPAGVRVPTEQELVNVRWTPLDVPSLGDPDYLKSANKAYAEFFDKGTWHGSDGCNGQGGRWALHPETGEWLGIGGASTLIGCANVDVNGAVNGASAVGIDGDELVFYDAKGDENGRFVMAG
jgi:hypothetical protein